MARTIQVPGCGALLEDGTDTYQVPGCGALLEDQVVAAQTVGGSLILSVLLAIPKLMR